MGHNHFPATAWELEAERRREVIEADVNAARAAAANHHAQGIGASGVISRLLGGFSIVSRRSTPAARASSTSARDDGVAPCEPATALRRAG